MMKRCALFLPAALSLALFALPAAGAALTSGIEPAYFDRSVKPGDDFFRYANGGWLSKTEIPAEKVAYGIDYLLQDQGELQLREIVEAAAQASASPGSETQKVGDLYNSFMDQARLEQLALAPLQGELARIDALQSRAGLPDLLAHYARVGVEGFFGSYVHQDNKDSSQYIVDFYQSGLGMPDRDYYLLKDGRFKALRKLYRQHAARVLAFAGVKDPRPAAQAVLALETRLARAHWNKVDSRDAIKTYNKYAVTRLPQLMPAFDFTRYLAAADVRSAAVVVSQPSYFSGLDRILRETPLPTLQHYLRVRLLDSYASYLHKALDDEHFAFYRTQLYGVQQQKPRWKRGVALIDGAIGEALGRIYVEKHFPAANKQRMQSLVRNLQTAFHEEIGKLDWMSAGTQKAARAKLATFVAKIGYPDRWRDYSRLSIRKDELLGNVMRANAFEYQRNLDKLGQPIDRNEWGMTPQTINAYYNPEQNEIVFPAAILQAPYFDMGADDAVNYGAIGAVIGHEISHGFDDQGSKYDGAGNLRDWWTAQDRQRFEQRAKGLVEQFNRYEPVKGFKINGALTLGENIADLAGAVIAYRAWQISLDGQSAPVIDGMSGAQRFWVGYARSWMTKYRDETLINLVKSDPHAPAEFRVNGVVTNVPEFYEAFDVQPGQRHYRAQEQRVRIW